MAILFKNDPFKHGFYEVNGHKTFSKMEAVELEQRFGVHSQWNFNQSVFGKENWLEEPTLDLSRMYRMRARQIRESYDYCVLFYSGGSDSNNILSYWLQEGLKLDEIATMWNLEGSKDKESYMNAEINHVVFDRVQKLKDQGLDFKFRLIDITRDTIDGIMNAGEDYIYLLNNHFTVNHIAKNNFRDKIKDYADLIAQGKSVCFVWGIEKPQIFPDGDRHYLQFFDMMDNCVSPYAQARIKQGWYDELFYWTPDMPELVIKQAHALLEFTETCHMPEFYQDKPNRYGYNRTLKQYVTSAAAKLILYPSWDPNTYCNGKPSNMVFSERDDWFWNGNSDQVTMMKSLADRFFTKIGSYWINDGVNPRSGIKCHCSPRYYLN
jgi:hypothetical protein